MKISLVTCSYCDYIGIEDGNQTFTIQIDKSEGIRDLPAILESYADKIRNYNNGDQIKHYEKKDK